MRRILAVLSACMALPAVAQPLPADCPAQPQGPPVTLGYQTPGGRHQGTAYAEFAAPAFGTTCTPAAPPLSRDVLRGEAGDPLTGRPPPPRQGRVLVEMPPAQ